MQQTNIPYYLDHIHLTFEDTSICQMLIEHSVLEEEDTHNDKHMFLPEERELIMYKTTKAFELIKLLHPNLYMLITRHLGTIYFAKKPGYGGGSISSILGLLWLNPPAKWSIVDYAEALYHEFIHNSLFLDDMVNSIFPHPADCLLEEALTTSTILKKKRLLDRSFHAANVAIGIMHFYHMLGDEAKSMQYKEDLELTLSEMNEKRKFFGERGIEILNEMNEFVKRYSYDDITYSLNK